MLVKENVSIFAKILLSIFGDLNRNLANRLKIIKFTKCIIEISLMVQLYVMSG